MSTPIGQMIRRARQAAGLTLEDVAVRVGVTPGALSHIESGRRLPYPQNAARIAEVLGLSADDILAALDEAHSQRRQSAVYEETDGARLTRTYSARPIETLFSAAPQPMSALHMSEPTLRHSARWGDDTADRLQALESMADTAAETIRTLRGLLIDDDPAVAREARRLLRELDVRLPDE